MAAWITTDENIVGASAQQTMINEAGREISSTMAVQ